MSGAKTEESVVLVLLEFLVDDQYSRFEVMHLTQDQCMVLIKLGLC